MSITQTTAGWSFVHKGQRYERPTRDAAAELLYDLQRDLPAPLTDADLVIQALEIIDEWERAQPIRVERQICDDDIDPRFGQEVATRFLIGGGDDEVELWIPDHPSKSSWTELYGLETDDGMSIEAVRHLLDVTIPMAQRLLADPRVKAAIADAEARSA